jgi:hypothetical protein
MWNPAPPAPAKVARGGGATGTKEEVRRQLDAEGVLQAEGARAPCEPCIF